ncbi:autotransporter domain-containing protein [Phreatobacter stygius]|uniref:Autotransporter domain-containing protein n=1 Tax=Phreatobacter stygius TaxID=1940610 RepID=A0A4D7B008_9HYPH|nr:autotransporter domain-containing protein [Phreatobacter stygius]QCI64188.1 autotransporter domain-containing protein [Phreatobacter stygius]
MGGVSSLPGTTAVTARHLTVSPRGTTSPRGRKTETSTEKCRSSVAWSNRHVVFFPRHLRRFVLSRTPRAWRCGPASQSLREPPRMVAHLRRNRLLSSTALAGCRPAGPTAPTLSLALAGLVTLLGAAPVSAADVTWIGIGNQSWTDGSQWSPANPPTSADRAILNGGGGPAVISTLSGVGVAGSIELRDNAQLILDNNATLGVGTNILIGTINNAAVSTLRVEGGAQTTTIGLFVGNATGSSGVVDVSGAASALHVIGQAEIGGSGAGTLTIRAGGAVSVGVGGIGTLNVGTAGGGAGTLRMGDATGVGTLAASTVDLRNNASSVVFDGTGSQAFAPLITGSGFVVKNGSGTVTLTGANSYTGGTTLNAGVLTVGNSAALGLGGLTVGGSSTLDSNASVSLGNAIVLNANLTIGGSNALTLNGGISGAGGLFKNGSATLTLNGVNTFTGGMAINGGTVQAASDGNLGTPGGQITFSNTTIVGGAGTGADAVLRTTTSFSSAKTMAFTSGGGRIETVAGTTLTLSGAISTGGSASFFKQGDGTLVLTGDSSANYFGRTWVHGGTLRIEGGGKLGSVATGGQAYISNGATVVVTGSGSAWETFSQMRVGEHGSGTLRIENGGTVRNGSGGGTVGIVGGGGASEVVITGLGSQWLGNGANLYVGHSNAGSLTVSDQGVLRLGAAGNGTIIAGLSGGAAGGTINIGAAEASAAAAAGTLQVGIVDLNAASRLAFNHTEAGYSFAPTIVGAGQVRQVNGTTILAGAHTYSGGTAIVGGVLQVTSEANLGDVAGGLTIGNGTLRVTSGFASGRNVVLTGASATMEIQAGGHVLSDDIDGAGGLTKTGAGTLTLTGANSYAGTTTISAGTLQLGTGGTSGSITGNVVNNAALIFNRSDAVTFTGAVSGSGTLRHIGGGLTNLSGNSGGFSGTTTVEAGTLAVNGALGGTLVVQSGATLGGIGTVGSLGSSATIAAGGVHAPGNSIGTQIIAGNYVNHGALVIEGTPAATDKLVVAGSVDISGATLNLVLSPATAASWPALNGPYILIDKQSAGAVTGTFGTVTNNLLFLDLSLNYAGGDGNDVTLQLTRNDASFSSLAITRNQIATAGAIESLPNSNPIWQAVALSSDPDIVRRSFDALSGEIHASAKTALVEDSRFVREAATDRLRAAFGAVAASTLPVMAYAGGDPIPVAATTDRLAVWGQAFGAWGHTKSDGNAARLDRSTGGFFLGADAPVFDSWRLGVLAGYSRTSFSARDRASNGGSDNYHLGLYGGTQWGSLGFRTGLAYTWHDISANRSVVFPGFNDSLKGNYHAGTFQAFGEFGYRIDLSQVALEPFANLAYVNLRTDGFTEQGGAAALSGTGQTTQATFTTLGLRAAAGFDLASVRATVRGTLGWRHAFGDITPLVTLAFAGSSAFTVGGVPIAKNAAVLEAGLDLNLSPAATLGLAYSGQLASGAQQHGMKANLAVRF